jgi:putative membrane protein
MTPRLEPVKRSGSSWSRAHPAASARFLCHGDNMISTVAAWLVAATAAAFIPASGSHSAKQEAKPSAQSFLQKAAEGQQAEIALGQLASERAGAQQVKQFGAQMIEDHRKARAEIQHLASKEGVALPTELTDNHKDKQEQFARLSGSEFDRAYIDYILRDHRKEVKEFERHVKAIKNPQVQQWAEDALPLLKQHLHQAEQIASSIGIDTAAR